MVKLPQYTRRDMLILSVTMPLVVALINSLLFGGRYFTEPKLLLLSSLVVAGVMTLAWFLFTWVAVTVRNRLPKDEDLIKRLIITIVVIGTIQALVIALFFKGYDYLHLFGYELNKRRFYWTLSISFILNILITLVHEGFESFEKWKSTFTQTEQLKKAYTQSRLMGLKSQVNPHFLFNSLNSLSSLISEDEEKAETFLNELTKVYRYLLRGSDDKLVSLETELKFINSYFYLLKARYGDAVNLSVDFDDDQRQLMIPPLALLTLFENAFNQNATHKDSPLNISISVSEDHWLELSHNIQRRIATIPADESGIDNLAEKIRLLTHQQINVSKTENSYTVKLPLIQDKTMELS